jgi:hypothetical protein
LPVGDDIPRVGDVLSRVGDASHGLTHVCLRETCVPLSAGGVSFRVGDAPSVAGDACHELTCAS